jgi:hypothetical protein
MSRAQLTSTVEQSNGGAVPPVVGGKNFIANGGMDIFQRSTSVTIPNTTPGYYAPDRFLFYSNGGSTTLSRVAGTAGITYATQVATTTGNTQINIENRLEYQQAQLLMGKTVTFSFYVNAATTSGVSIAVGDYYPSSLDNWASVTFAQKGTVSAAQLSAGNWVRQSVTFTADTNTTGLGFYLTIGGLGANTLQTTGWQVEIGNVATPFSRAGSTLQGELALCQRYLPSAFAPSGSAADAYVGYAYATNSAIWTVPFPTQARTVPTGLIPVGTFNGYALNSPYSVTPAFNGASLTAATVYAASGMTITAGQGARLVLQPGAAILFTGCEL